MTGWAVVRDNWAGTFIQDVCDTQTDAEARILELQQIFRTSTFTVDHITVCDQCESQPVDEGHDFCSEECMGLFFRREHNEQATA
jgi:hypothetical protein